MATLPDTAEGTGLGWVCKQQQELTAGVPAPHCFRAEYGKWVCDRINIKWADLTIAEADVKWSDFVLK